MYDVRFQLDGEIRVLVNMAGGPKTLQATASCRFTMHQMVEPCLQFHGVSMCPGCCRLHAEHLLRQSTRADRAGQTLRDAHTPQDHVKHSRPSDFLEGASPLLAGVLWPFLKALAQGFAVIAGCSSQVDFDIQGVENSFHKTSLRAGNTKDIFGTEAPSYSSDDAVIKYATDTLVENEAGFKLNFQVPPPPIPLASSISTFAAQQPPWQIELRRFVRSPLCLIFVSL